MDAFADDTEFASLDCGVGACEPQQSPGTGGRIEDVISARAFGDTELGPGDTPAFVANFVLGDIQGRCRLGSGKVRRQQTCEH